MSKITVIGAGSVGASVANDLMVQGIASEILLVDVNKKKASGEALDIYQGAPFHSPAVVRSGDYADAAGSDIVVITCGIARKPGMTRLDLAQTNVSIIKDVAKNIVPCAPEANYVIVSNPVDILTYVFHKVSGLPENQIIGSGTLLDTSRLRYGLSEHFQIAQKNIHAYVFGEHGDTSFIPWSVANISGCDLDAYEEILRRRGHELEPLDKEAMLDYVRKSGGKIIARKGATFYAVSVAVTKLCSVLLSAYNSMASVSSMMHGEYGIEDVCLSTLTMIGPDGVQDKIPVQLTEEEVAKLQSSANALKAVIAQIQL